MQSLIVRRGLTKRAAGEDGPSFEQQFGILTNAIIADKFPAMDSMKLAFQLIEKTPDNAEACGAAVYLVGKNVIFVPSFFKNNKLKTGDMMFIAQTQQFLPLSDPWIAWLKNKDLNDVGELLPEDAVDNSISTKGTTIRDIADPIIKTASVYLRGLLHADPDTLKKAGTKSGLLDTVIGMGKQASEALLDNLVKDTDFLNAALTFYSGDELDGFAKNASAMAEPVKEVELILPFEKEAKSLSAQELKALYKDGFFIKQAADVKPADVIRSKQLDGMFTSVTGPGQLSLLKLDGNVEPSTVLIEADIKADPLTCGRYHDRNNDLTADSCFNHSQNLLVVSGDNVSRLPAGAMRMVGGSSQPMTPDQEDVDAFKKAVSSVGQELTYSMKSIPEGSWLVFPNGTASKWYDWGCSSTDNNDGWVSRESTVTIATKEQAGLVKPLVAGNHITLPANTRIIMQWNYNSDGTRKTYSDPSEEEKAYREHRDGETSSTPAAYVTLGSLDAFITEFCNKNYHKARIYNNGSDYVVSGDKSADDSPKSIKEAALALVKDYSIDPAIAKVMLKEASNGATYDRPRSTTYYITKTAAVDEPMWQDANIPMQQAINVPSRIEQQQMPTFLEDPAQLQKAVTTAAQAGIKEVFDITALKLLIRQNHFFDEIHDDIPLFMQALDSLCRKLFQFYWHTDKMEEKYGMVKMKALEDSIKCTLDSLSELTIFFKLRTVDGTGLTGDGTGDLMSGQML